MQEPVSETATTGQNSPGLRRMISQFTGSKYFKLILAVLKVLAGLVFLLVAVRQIQWGNLASTIQSANLAWLLAALLSVLVGLCLKYLRWVSLIRNYEIQSGPANLFRAYFVGQAVNIVLPFRGGELVRIGYFSNQPSVIPEVASTIVLEKYLDLMALTITAILISTQLSLDRILNVQGWLLPLTTILTILLLAAVLIGPDIWVRLRTRRILPDNIAILIDRWVDASIWLRKPSRVIPSLVITALIWIVMGSTNLLLFRSLKMPLGATAAGLVLILVYIGLIPALMPGNLGPFYFFAQLAVIPFGIFHLQALSYAVILHFIVTTPPLVCGAIGLLWRDKPKVEA